MKFCNKCKQDKVLADFPKNKNTSSGFGGHCKACHNNYYTHKPRKIFNTLDLKERKEVARLKIEAYRRQNPLKYILANARARAKRENILFNLVEADLILPTHCPILGMELVYGGSGISEKGYGASPNAASLDRIDGKKGYVKGNVSIISWKANRAKCQLSVDDIIRMAEYFSWLVEEEVMC